MAFESSVAQAVVGPDTVIRLRWRDTQGGGIPTFAARNFGIQDATLCEFTSDWQVNQVGIPSRSRAEWGIFRSEVGGGIVVAIDQAAGTWGLSIGTALGWSAYGSFIDSTTSLPGLAANTFFRMHIKAEVKGDDTTTVTATVRDLSDNDIGSVTATVNVPRGNYCGFHSTFDQLGAASTADFKNIRVQASGSTGITPNLTAVNYVWTLVNDLGEEGAPSFPTADVLRPDGVAVTVTTSTTVPTGYDAVTHKRIYRLVSGNTGDLYRLVTELPIGTADFLDNLADNQLSLSILESQDFDLPPATLEGIIALPNGIYAGFFENNLCLSAKGWAHAWPIRQRLPVDSDIVAIANIDNTIVIGTKTYVYTASGSDPASYTMSKPGAPQSCSSKLGMTFLDGQGVIFPSPDGWCVCAGSAGAVTVATEGVFTKEQWQALNPESIVAAVHDGVLHWWYDTGGAGPGNWLGYNAGGFGPIMYDQGIFQALGTAVAFADGVFFDHTNFTGGDGIVHIPFSGGDAEAPTLVENVTWFPSIPGDPAPTISTTDPSGGAWTGYSWVLRATHDGFAVLTGPTGVTVVTVNADTAPFFYEGATLEYFDLPTPPSATTAALPYDEPATIVEDVVSWFVFTLASPTTIDFRTTGAASYTQIALFAANGALIAEDNASLGFDSEIAGRSLPAGTFYAAVAGEFTQYGFGFGAVPSSPTESGALNVVIEETP